MLVIPLSDAPNLNINPCDESPVSGFSSQKPINIKTTNANAFELQKKVNIESVKKMILENFKTTLHKLNINCTPVYENAARINLNVVRKAQ